jgi:glutathione peroxidase
MSNIYDFEFNKADGSKTTFNEFKGKTVLVVNVASRCGFTSQYEGLEKLYKNYKDKNFTIVGFPCNQFGSQEPGSDSEIQEFCKLNYGVSFPVMQKVNVNGDEALQFYKHLKAEAKGLLGSEAIKWNFTKFLIDKNGKVVDRFAPQTKPEELASEIEKII